MTASPESAAGPVKRRGFGLLPRVRLWIRTHSRALLIALLILLSLFAYAAPSMIVVVPAGHGGVLWRGLAGGTVRGMALLEGIHVIAPWDRLYLYDIRRHEETRTYSAIAGNGLSIEVDIGFIYHLRPETLGNLHQEVGPDYLEILLMSQIGTVARDSIARWPADALYSPERARIEEDIFTRLVDRTNFNSIRAAAKVSPTVGEGDIDDDEDDYFELDTVMIREVTLPEQVQSAIRRKIEQQEMALEYQYRLARERLESERKAVEAEGIRKFQETVQQGISDTYLAWRGIEATLQLAASSNAKVVVIGNSANGLPLIFNTGQDAGTALASGTAPAASHAGAELSAAANTPTAQPPPVHPPPANTPAATSPPGTTPPAQAPQRRSERDAPPERASRPPEIGPAGAGNVTDGAATDLDTDTLSENAHLTIPYLNLTVPHPFR